MIPRIAGLDLSRDDLQKQINLILDDIEIQLTTDGVDIGAVPRTIAGSDDVTITGLGNPDVLTWDSATEKWINQTAVEAGLQTTLTFGRGLMKPASDVYVKEKEIDHDILDNTHNLTTDIDHDALTNYVAIEHLDWSADQGATNINDANITATAITQHVAFIDHDSLLNTHNLTTSIDHNTITNNHNLTTDIDHDALTNFVANEHIDWTADQGVTNINDANVTVTAITQHVASINHDSLLNTHNLTTDIDHDALTNFVANEHTDHTGVTLTAGNGLTGGGDISSNRTFAVGAGTGITVNADSVETDDANIDHDALSNYAVNEHIDWTTASASKATRSTSQSIPNASETIVVFTTEEYDYQSEYDTSNGRFTADADGVYSVKAAVQFVANAWVAGEAISLRLYKNTSADEILDKWKCQANVTYAMSVQGSTDIELTAGDYIRVAVYQSSGGALNTSAAALANRFCVHKIR